MANRQREFSFVQWFPFQRLSRVRPLWLLIAIVAAVLVCGISIRGIQVMRLAHSRKGTQMHFQEVAMGLENYCDSYGHLPYPARSATREPTDTSPRIDSPTGRGQSLYSWRVEIVPFFVSWHGPWDKSKPWNSPTNRQLLELSGFYGYDQSFFSASASQMRDQAFPDSNILAITGPGTAFGDGDEEPKTLKGVPPDTIVVVESQASGIPWPAPGDFDIRTMPQTICESNGKGISSQYPGGFYIIFADMRVWRLSDKVPFDTLKQFFTINGAKTHERETLLGPYALEK